MSDIDWDLIQGILKATVLHIPRVEPSTAQSSCLDRAAEADREKYIQIHSSLDRARMQALMRRYPREK